MAESCCAPTLSAETSASYRRVLWVALAVNALMFAVEIVAGMGAESTSLLADAVDFAGDAANYGLSLGALSLAVVWQSRAALLKGASMTAYGVGIIAFAGYRLFTGAEPQPITMGVVGALALAANIGVAILLYRFRDGDANMRSVWLCTRNDAIGNVAVLAAALGVFGTGSALPDLAVALAMSLLAIWAGVATVRLARTELRALAAPLPDACCTTGACEPGDAVTVARVALPATAAR